MAKKSYKIAVTGDKELDRKLKAIADQDGPRSVNAEMRKSTREAIKTLVMPEVKANVPYETGLLESQLTVKAIARSRTKMGSAVGFRDDLFKGETFYAGFLEYGFNHRNGISVPGDSFLRAPLYRNEQRVRRHIINRLKDWVRKSNR